MYKSFALIFVLLAPCAASADDFYGRFIGYLDETYAVFILPEGDLDVLACAQTRGSHPFPGAEYIVAVSNVDYVSHDIFEASDDFNAVALYSICQVGG